MKLSLRASYLLPALVILLLPPVGHYGVQWLTRAVTNVERERLAVAAIGVAGALASQPSLREQLAGDGAMNVLPVTRLDSPPVLDGRDEDWSTGERVSFGLDDLVRINFPYLPESLTWSLRLAENDTHLYLFYRVQDDRVVYREINGLSVSRNDHIRMLVQSEDGLVDRLTLAVLQPGPVTAHQVSATGRSLRVVDKVEGAWRATEAGYNVELRLPLSMVGARIATAIVDVDDPVSRDIRYVMGRTAAESPSDLAPLRAPVALRDFAAALPWAYVRIANADGDLVATAGDREGAFTVTIPIQHDEASLGELTLGSTVFAATAISEIALQFTWATSAFLFFGVAGFLLLMARASRRRLDLLRAEIHEVATAEGRVRQKLRTDHRDDPISGVQQELGEVLLRVSQYNDYLERMASRLNHELRTPVSVVSSSLDSLAEGTVDTDQAIYVDRARQGINRLSTILNKLGEARRLEESLDADAVEVFDLQDLLTGCVAGYEAAWPQQAITLSIETTDTRVTGIPDLLVQMLDKLMENAVDFSSGNEPVKVRLTGDAETLKLRIANAGMPVGGEAESLFESMVTARGDDGTHLGLGLYIARVIVTFHGGDIAIVNREDTPGAVVTVNLPVMRLTSRLA